MSKFAFRIFTPLCALFILLGACAQVTPAAAPAPTQPAAPAAASASTGAPTSLRLIILPFITYAPYWIAQDDGYFKEQGLDVELVNMTGQNDVLPAVLSGQADVTAGQVFAGMFNAIANGADLKVVAGKGYIDPKGCDYVALIGRKGAFASNNLTPAEFHNAKLSVGNGSWNHYYLEKMVEALKLGAIEGPVSTVGSPAILEAMGKGQVDLVVQNEPWLTRLLDAGNVKMEPSIAGLMPNSQSAVMFYGPKLMGENAEVGKRFMLAYLKAVQQYNEGKTDRNVEILAKYTKLDPALVKRMCWPTIKADGAVNLDSVLDFQKWAQSKGLVKTPVTAEQLYDPSFARYAAQQLGIASK